MSMRASDRRFLCESIPVAAIFAMLLGACSAGTPAYYLWTPSDMAAKPAHPPVACSSQNALDKFVQLYESGAPGDEQEQATLLGESKIYASDNPPDPPCRRVGRPMGPVQKPGSVDRVANVIVLNNGLASFTWEAATRPAGQYYTFPEYLVSAQKPSEER